MRPVVRVAFLVALVLAALAAPAFALPNGSIIEPTRTMGSRIRIR
jgi:hypothetical protein